MKVIVSYDLKRNHTEIKNELKTLGYVDEIRGVNLSTNAPVDQKLPNTTLIKLDAISTKVCADQVFDVIAKHDGGSDVVFAAELDTSFNWNSR